MTRAGLVGTVLLVSVLGYVVFQSFQIESATCEVCVEYNGRSQCRTVAGATIDEAREGAINNACAFVSSGVTDSMACARTKPLSITCR